MDQGNDEIFKLCKLSEVSNSQGVSHSIPVLLGPSLFNADGRDGAYYEYSFRQLDCHDDMTYKEECLSLFPLRITLGTTQTFPCLAQLVVFQSHDLFFESRGGGEREFTEVLKMLADKLSSGQMPVGPRHLLTHQ